MRKLFLIIAVLVIVVLVVGFYPSWAEKPVKDGTGPMAVRLDPACPRRNITARWRGGRRITWMPSTAATWRRPTASTATGRRRRAIIVMGMWA